ncbi:MAG TPA: hypothetical protein VHR43_08010 [Gemmatimonadales bacterium]|nr:hypothetical protein [Gemmatimonadales bacterium]
MRRAVRVAILLLASHPVPLLAQSWNAPPALALVRRATERRLTSQADSTLRSYRTRAHGFVFFLAQVGEGLAEPPRLVKADELRVEVYWRAPDRSKQVIRGWRDGAFLPTDISYHRDHLGIVTNNFGNVIRIGEGDEVRDVPHPLSPEGLAAYDFALGDSLAIRTAAGETVVREVQVRPRSFARPLVVGTLYLDVATADLVRFRFSFTPPAYLDPQLEDISIVLENSLVEHRYWLPYRQEVEIRRRTRWLDFPARGIIRGRWEIEGYDLNLALPDASLTGPTIGGLTRAQPDDSSWGGPLSGAVAGVAPPVNRQDMDALRVEVERIAGARALSGLPASRLAAGSVSDVVHVNRVQGLTLGVGGVLGVRARRIGLRPSLAYGTSDHRVTGGLTLTAGLGATQVSVTGGREIRDLSDRPVISPLLNSLLSQEAGRDHGDYVLLTGATASLRHRLSGRTALGLSAGAEETRSVVTRATPASGRYQPNPALGAGTWGIGRIELERASGGIAVARDLQGQLAVEGGVGPGPDEYVRATADGRWLTTVGGHDLVTRVSLGAATAGMPAYRSFVLGGRGTLVSEPYRAYGGRQAALGQVEWRFDVPVPALPLGSFASTGRRLTVAPFFAAGAAGRSYPGLPWSASDGIRPVAGVALEWFMRLIRIEAGIGLRRGDFGLTVDVNRDWWGLL